MTVVIRRIEERDEVRWRELWNGYNSASSEGITDRLWACIIDTGSPINAIVAENEGAAVTGIANYIIHETTSAISPVCYLQDLFVDPNNRGLGVGRLLIDWLVAEMNIRGWSRLYWCTKEDNYRARGLYDKYAPHSGFLRYVIENPGN